MFDAGSKSLDRLNILALSAFTLVGFALRVYQLPAQSIWFDEAHSIYAARQPLAEIPQYLGTEHLPFYFIVLHFWIYLTGTSEFSLRFLTVLVDTLAIPAAYALGRRLLGREAGPLAALLTSISPLLIYYAQETRMYALLPLLSLLSTYSLVRGIETGGFKSWIGYAVTTCIALYTHYYSALLLPFHLAIVLIHSLTLWRQRCSINDILVVPRGFLLAGGAATLMFLPWAMSRMSLFSDYITASPTNPLLETMFWESLIYFSLGFGVENYKYSVGLSTYAGQFGREALLAAPFLAFVGVGVVSWEKGRRAALATCILYLLVPFMMLYILSVNRRAFAVRYALDATPAFLLLVAAGLVVLRRRWLRIPAVLTLVAISGVALASYYYDPAYARPDFRSAIAHIESAGRPNEGVILNAAYSFPAFVYYYRGGALWYGLPQDVPPVPQKVEAELRAVMNEHDFLTLVLWQDYHSDPHHFVENWLNDNAFRVGQKQFHGGINVVGYLTRPPVTTEEAVTGRKVGESLANKVELLSYDIAPQQPVSGDEAKLVLYWRALDKIDREYMTFAHLINGAHQVWAQHDGPPQNRVFGTHRWPEGAIVRDEFPLRLLPFTPPGEYRIEVGMYELPGVRRLSDGVKDRITLGPIVVRRGVEGGPNPQYPMSIDLSDSSGGKARLLGFDLKDSMATGEQTELTLYWQSLSPFGHDYTVFTHIVDDSERIIAQKDNEPVAGLYPTSKWQNGEVVRDRYLISIDARTPPGDYSLEIGMYDAATGQRLDVRGSTPHEADKALIGRVRLAQMK